MSGKGARPSAALSLADRRLWAAYTRHVIPMHEHEEEFHALSEEGLFEATMEQGQVTPAAPAKAAAKTPATLAPKAPAVRRGAVLNQHHQIDGATARKLKRGQKPIEAVIDLHGLGREAAYDALLAKVRGCERQGIRFLLVITGKGSRAGGQGVLRQALPRWLEDEPLAHSVLAAQTAQAQHGGSGACYLLLRQQPKTKER